MNWEAAYVRESLSYYYYCNESDVCAHGAFVFSNDVMHSNRHWKYTYKATTTQAQAYMQLYNDQNDSKLQAYLCGVFDSNRGKITHD